MKLNKRLLLICTAIPLFVGILAGLMTRDSMEAFGMVAKPPLSPPAWLFLAVWTILYILMGISSYIVLTSDAPKAEMEGAMKIYGYQLAVNFLWPTFFFSFGWYLFAFLWLVLLWALVFAMIRRFFHVNQIAGYFNVPYLAWLTFAGYLNVGIWLLNL